MKRGVRGIAFVVAALAHIALVTLLMTATKPRTRDPVETPRMTVIFLEPETRERERADEPPPPVTPSLRLPSRDVSIELPQLDTRSAITAPPDLSPGKDPASPSIDWQQETRTAAARMAESLDAERRRKGKLTPDPRFTHPTPGPEFGWDKSKTHRIESLPEGGTIIHLNDRCALLLNGMLLPICKIGKIPARGDLFEHMGEAHDPDE
jgi:hypothetical protein